MIKIFIIDDETPVRQWIRFCIERSGDDFQVVGEAVNGKEGLKALEKVETDIVILDIMMPGMTGLEVLEQLKKLQPNVYIIMLTNFAEFEYIQKAVRNGSSEYFLKSEITEKSLMHCLNKLALSIKKNSLMENLGDEMEGKTIRQLGTAILNGSISGKAQFLEKASAYPAPISFTNHLFVIGVRHDGHASALFSVTPNREISEYLSTMHHISFQSRLSFLVCEMNTLKSQLVIFNAIANILSWIAEHTNYEYIGISNIYPDFGSFYNAMTEAMLSLDTGFYKSKGAVTYVHQTNEPVNSTEFLQSLNKKLVNIVKNQSLDELEFEMKQIFDYFRKTTPLSSADTIDYFLELLYLIRSVYMSKTQNFKSVQDNTGMNIRQQLQKCIYLDQLQEQVQAAIRSIFTVIDAPSYSPPVTEAIQYIKDHYCENITLREVSAHIHMNTDYLGKIFKKETGISFNAYVTTIKMEYAEYLLRNSNLKKYEIAEKLGYTNFSYFSRIYSSHKGKKT